MIARGLFKDVRDVKKRPQIVVVVGKSKGTIIALNSVRRVAQFWLEIEVDNGYLVAVGDL